MTNLTPDLPKMIRYDASLGPIASQVMSQKEFAISGYSFLDWSHCNLVLSCAIPPSMMPKLTKTSGWPVYKLDTEKLTDGHLHYTTIHQQVYIKMKVYFYVLWYFTWAMVYWVLLIYLLRSMFTCKPGRLGEPGPVKWFVLECILWRCTNSSAGGSVQKWSVVFILV